MAASFRVEMTGAGEGAAQRREDDRESLRQAADEAALAATLAWERKPSARPTDLEKETEAGGRFRFPSKGASRENCINCRERLSFRRLEPF